MPNGGRKKQQKKADDAGIASKLDRLLSRIPKGTFATVGGLLGPKGAAAGQALSTITGYGDYTVARNSLMSQTVIGEMADQVPVFRNQGADTRVKHCEFVTDLVSNGSAFDITTLPIDPTDDGTFPWLSSVAKKYQKYKVKGMVIGYRSTSTDYNNSGVVAIAVNYDPAERAFSTMEGILNSKFAVSTKPSVSMLAPVECDPGRSPADGYYMKHATSNDVTDATIRQTRMGTINVATQGLSLAAGTTIGQIYVSYDIELLYPYMSVGVDEPSGHIGIVNYATQNALDSDLRARAYGDLVGYGDMTAGKIGVKLNGAPTGVDGWYSLVLPPGTYELSTADFGWYSGTQGVYGGVASPWIFGEAIDVNSGTIRFAGDTAASEGYVLTVGAGSEAARTVTPYQAAERTIVGGTTYIGLGLSLRRIK